MGSDQDSDDKATDLAWEEWGRRDPYFSVMTNPRFRRAAMDADEGAKQEFFAISEAHVQDRLAMIRHHINPAFAPKRILDFGCGVGRLLPPFSAAAEQVVGVDVSPAMLQEARRNCDEFQLKNVLLVQSDDELSALPGEFDLIHSFIVFQHIPVTRGRTILSNLLRRLQPGGVIAIHLTYSKARFASTHGVAPPPPPVSERTLKPGADPEMQMNPYHMNEVLFLLQSTGISQCHLEFTDHSGELGMFLYGAAPGAAAGH